MTAPSMIYFTPNLDPASGKPAGVCKKIAGQVAGCKQLGLEIEIVGGKQFMGAPPGGNLVQKVIKRLRSSARLIQHDRRGYQRALAAIQATAPRAVYIRYSYASLAFIRFLHSLHRISSKPLVLLEIATYPYDSERSVWEWATWEDRICRHFLKGRVDRIVTFTDLPEIFGVPTINTRNGIDVQSVPFSSPPAYDGTALELIGVANLAFWTGYDRVLRGMAEYQRRQLSPKIHFTVVGDGPALESLRSTAASLNLESTVTFTGPLYGQELDSVFPKAHMALGSQGLHRLGLTNNPVLKHREYCARGIPFIIATGDDGFPADAGFVYKAPADESPLDLLGIVKFYEELHVNQPDYASQMRRYAQSALDWSIQMAPVVDFVTKERVTS